MTPHRDYEPETHFVGDSQTAEAIRDLRLYIETFTDQISGRIDHIVGHDRAFPTEGCSYCEVPSAA